MVIYKDHRQSDITLGDNFHNNIAYIENINDSILSVIYNSTI